MAKQSKDSSKDNSKDGSKEISDNQAITEKQAITQKPKSNVNNTSSIERPSKQIVRGKLIGERVILESSDPARDLFASSRYGTVLSGGRVQLSMLESLYLVEKEKVMVLDGRGRMIDFDKMLIFWKKIDKNLYTKYCVFRDLRSRGYIVKTALKFGADLRVYDRGVKPGEDHAKWIVYPVHESQHLTWYEFAAKNRVAHSTKKRLLMAIVDDEDEVTYYENKWTRP